MDKEKFKEELTELLDRYSVILDVKKEDEVWKISIKNEKGE